MIPSSLPPPSKASSRLSIFCNAGVLFLQEGVDGTLWALGGDGKAVGEVFMTMEHRTPPHPTGDRRGGKKSWPAPHHAFPDTQWSMLRKAAGGGDAAAWSALCSAYWHPVYSFVRSLGCGQDDARDVTQGFFTALLERNDVSSVDVSRGRFRAWLRTAAKHYLFNELDRDRAEKRGGGRPHVSFELAVAGGALHASLTDELTPDQLFDRSWARTIVERALTRLRAQLPVECDGVLVEQLLSDDERPSDAETAAMLGVSLGKLRVDRHRTKERLKAAYHACLRMEIAPTVESPAAIDDELRELLDVLR
jgi:RNA polymerase sigma-70 factor (ECF subfamily)